MLLGIVLLLGSFKRLTVVGFHYGPWPMEALIWSSLTLSHMGSILEMVL